jgi:hypothetical protein
MVPVGLIIIAVVFMALMVLILRLGSLSSRRAAVTGGHPMTLAGLARVMSLPGLLPRPGAATGLSAQSQCPGECAFRRH